MEGVVVENLFGSWKIGTLIVIFQLVTEAALLFVAAQAGFLDGPRILSNMAIDSWMPHRFSQLSDRLVTQDGIFMMGLAGLGALLYTRGDVTTLVVMYSINVFITFSLSLLGMSKHWIQERHRERKWKSRLAIHGIGFVMCVSILVVTIFEKFRQGGWITVVITGVLIAIAFSIHKHYDRVRVGLRSLDGVLTTLPPVAGVQASEQLDQRAPTAILVVSSSSGLGVR